MSFTLGRQNVGVVFLHLPELLGDFHRLSEHEQFVSFSGHQDDVSSFVNRYLHYLVLPGPALFHMIHYIHHPCEPFHLFGVLDGPFVTAVRCQRNVAVYDLDMGRIISLEREYVSFRVCIEAAVCLLEPHYRLALRHIYVYDAVLCDVGFALSYSTPPVYDVLDPYKVDAVDRLSDLYSVLFVDEGLDVSIGHETVLKTVDDVDLDVFA